MIEFLETRTMFAMGIGVGYYGPLYINGTSAADTITFTQSGDTLTVVLNGVSKNHSLYHNIPGTTPGSSIGQHVITRIVVDGKEGNDVIKANDSVVKAMEIFGGAGNDSVVGGFGEDTIYGGTSAYTGAPETGQDTLEGGWDDDKLYASASAGCLIRGGFGNDLLYGGSGVDTLFGGYGSDTVLGNGGNDWVLGDVGNDVVNGGSGNDLLFGGDNDDTLSGGSGDDGMWGDAGYDTFNAEDGDDSYRGGDGIDTISYSARVTGQSISQDGVANDGQGGEADNVGDDIEYLYGSAGNDVISGSPFANKIWGGAGADSIRGGDARDIIYGEAGNDEIWGDGGDDVLDGGSLADSLHGGIGNDLINGGDYRDILWGDAGDDSLHGNAGDDTLVGIGGGVSDRLYGEAGNDGFWLDGDSTETHDADSAESSARNVHRVNNFMFGISKNAVGQDLADPDADVNNAGYSPVKNRFDANPLFDDNLPRISDVNQGALGDCYFLGGLGAIAKQNPDVIRQSIVDLGDDTYAVRFYRDGAWEYYRVDNELPARVSMNADFSLNYSGVAYAGLGSDGALWAPLMEKAYVFYECGFDAQYGVIEGGFCDYAFKALNISTWDKDTDDDDAMSVIANQLAAGNAVTVATSFSLNGFDTGDSIVLNHCYTVISIDQAAGTITLRNPWGSDAGTAPGSWVQGNNDGYVTFTWQSFVDHTARFYVGSV
jgi:Ca2+-binding RTX toxin-like protein